MTINNGKTVNLELANVLEYQDKIREGVKTIAHLEAAIEVQQSIISAVTGYKTELPDLHTRREDLLAEIIADGASKEDLANLDEEIRIEKERLEGLVSHAAQSVPEAEQAIAGLRRKLEVAIAELDALNDRKPELLAAFLQAEAERLGGEYLQLTKELIVKYRLLLAYGPLLREVDGGRVLPWSGITIPLFQGLEAHRGQDSPNMPGEILEVVKARTYPNFMTDAIKEEKVRIAELGVKW
jgi:hypothetical protein